MRQGKITHIALMRMQYDYNRMQVLFLTGMSESMLWQFQFDTGLQWLTKYTLCDDDMLRWLLSQPIVWKWWMNEWNRRDEEYLPILYSLYEWNPREVKGRYKALHYGCFVEMTYPWRMLENEYNRAIGEQNKQRAL